MSEFNIPILATATVDDAHHPLLIQGSHDTKGKLDASI